jgi:hypothetical protein
MVQVRSIEQCQQEYFNALANSGSGIVIDGVEGSLAYTLSRASAVMAATLDEQLASLETEFTLTTASDVFLDRLGAFYLPRRKGVAAQGTALISSLVNNAYPLFYRTRLINLQSGLEYFTTNINQVFVQPYVEIPITIEAVEPGALYNMSAATQLSAPEYPDIQVIIANQRSNNAYTGGLDNGRDIESDESYRSRLLTYFSQGPISTNLRLENRLLDYGLVDRAFVRTPAPGFVEVWLDSSISYSKSQITEIYSFVQEYLSQGVVPMISQVGRRSVKVEIEVVPFPGSLVDLNVLSAQISSDISTYFDSLRLEQPLLVSQMLNTVRPLARNIIVRQPTTDVYPAIGEVVVSGGVKVIYSLS